MDSKESIADIPREARNDDAVCNILFSSKTDAFSQVSRKNFFSLMQICFHHPRQRESEYHFNHTHTYTGVTNHSDARERER